MSFTIVKKDLFLMKVDALVLFVGPDEYQSFSSEINPLNFGDVAIIPTHDPRINKLILARLSIYVKGNQEKTLLHLCYKNSLEQARSAKCKSIAFPLLSTDVYGYPPSLAYKILTSTIREFLHDDDDYMDIYLVLPESETGLLQNSLHKNIQEYLSNNYTGNMKVVSLHEESVPPQIIESWDKPEYFPCCEAPQKAACRPNLPLNFTDYSRTSRFQRSFCYQIGLSDTVTNMNDSFSETLLILIEKKNKTEPEVYKTANVDRRVFSRIRTRKNYTPKKTTILALAIALELSIDETNNLLCKAGFALSPSILLDVIVSFFIKEKTFDIFEINAALSDYDQPQLGANTD